MVWAVMMIIRIMFTLFLYYYAMDTDLVIANLNYIKSNQLKATARFASPPYASPPCQRGHLLSTCWSTHPCFPFSTPLCWMESNRCSGYEDEEDYTETYQDYDEF